MAQRSYLMLLILVCGVLASIPSWADEDANNSSEPDNEGFVFTREKSIACTSVKNQADTSTCWSFATSSFIESELLRMGKGEFDLSEMYVVRQTYPRKAQRFVRLHGNSVLAAGSLAGDVLRVWNDYGAVPEDVYDGKYVGQSQHNQYELDKIIRNMLQAVVANPGKQLSPAWKEAVHGVLDAYLGEVPETFTYRGATYTPRSFADSLGFVPDHYVSLTSYTHHPFYREVNLEIPDNWAGNRYWNVPLDELMHVLSAAIDAGFSVAWDGDVSEKGFSSKKGVAILPEKPWHEKSKDERDAICDAPEPELAVTQEVRQQHFDNYTSTDDHLMHIVGTAHDQHGTRYFVTKNSYGTLDRGHNGFVHMSEAFVRSKTISILVHRSAIPIALAKKLGIAVEDASKTAKASR